MPPAWTATIHHDGSPRYLTMGEAALGTTVTLRLRAGLDAPIERLFLRTAPDGEQALAEMHPTFHDTVCRWWEIAIPLQMLRTSYRFLLMTSVGSWWYAAAGLTRHTPNDATDFKLLAHHYAPPWVRDSVFYQIFPDRFADGDPSNNVRDGEYSIYDRPTIARQWGELPRGGEAGGSREFFGGDLQGIAQKLGYLEELGVSALYLNPIFTSPSNHKYDVADYRHVDPHLGGDAALIELREALDERGMRVLLDIVPNHCGALHPWFQAARADPYAASAEFFTFHHHPDDYESWLGVKSLPKLNYRSEQLRHEMYAGPNAIMRYWMRSPFRIDGWRIDVANMLARQGETQLGHKIGRALRRALKSESLQAYLIGEHFYDGTPHLQGDELDASMNYQGFTFPLWRWLSGFELTEPCADPTLLPTEALAAQWNTFMAAIPWQIATQQFNLLGSHDTPRILTIVGENSALSTIATTLLMTYPGVPCIYYGDEIGMTGGADPECRRCMDWNPKRWFREPRPLYRMLIRLRRTAPALRYGGYQLLYAAGDTLAYQREASEERLIIIARRADDGLAALPVRHAGLADGVYLHELISGTRAKVEAGQLPLDKLPPIGAQIWRLKH